MFNKIVIAFAIIMLTTITSNTSSFETSFSFLKKSLKIISILKIAIILTAIDIVLFNKVIIYKENLAI